VRRGLDSPTPLTEIDPGDLFAVHPATLGAALNDLPEFSGSRGLSSNSGTGNFGSGPSTPNPDANVLNLRNMGYTRTLILFDGKRVPPTQPDGTIDVNMIPQMLLKRVDIVTGGASAVYGSDAVTGVVNFITDTHFTGLTLKSYAGISHDHDGFTNDEGVAWGTNLFGGRSHFEASFEHHDDPDILLRSERQWGRDVWTVQGAGTAASPYHLIENTRIGASSFGGLISSGALTGEQFAGDGVLSPFVHGAPTGTPGFESGGDGAYYNSSFKAAQQLDQLFARFDYDISDSVHLDASLAANYNFNANVGQYSVLSKEIISAQNAYLASDYQAALAAAGQSTFNFNKVWTDVPAQGTDTWERNYFAGAQLQGQFGSGYTWHGWYTHGETRQATQQVANINNEHLAAALDAVVNPANGQIVCQVTLTNPRLYPGCAPLDVFGPNAESQAAIDYIVTPTEFVSTQTQDDVSAVVTGAPLQGWAGPVNVALSAEWRRNAWRLVSQAQPTDPVSCVGLVFNCTASTLLWANGSTPDRSPVSEAVSEGAVEIEIPVAAHEFLAKNVNLNGAGRYTNYSTSGGALTWKAGLDWKLDDQFTLRATRSRDIRAPTLSDLFFPRAVTTTQLTDRLTGLTPLVPSISGGNPNLKPEIGYTTTAGVVYRPEWLKNASLTLDGFWITIENAITSIQGNNPSVQAACYASGGTSPFCALQQRPHGFADASPSNAVTEWRTEEINIASQHTEGADVEANYFAEPFSHPLNLRALATYQPHIIYSTPGLQTIDVGGVAFSSNGLQASPVWRATFIGSYSPVHNFTATVMERWRSTLAWTGDPTQIVSTPKIGSVAYTDLNLAYNLHPGEGELQLFFNVQNLFNRLPPPAAFLGSNSMVGFFGGFVYGDDPVGAYFTLGARFRM
jgi:outer membrane receptor protein involved in Fe transport